MSFFSLHARPQVQVTELAGMAAEGLPQKPCSLREAAHDEAVFIHNYTQHMHRSILGELCQTWKAPISLLIYKGAKEDFASCCKQAARSHWADFSQELAVALSEVSSPRSTCAGHLCLQS